MIPAPPPGLRDGRGSDPGYRLGLLAGGVRGGLDVVGGHFDPQHTLAAVADEVEGFGADDLTGNRLPISAALTRDDSSHDSSAGGRPVRSARPRSFPPALAGAGQSTAPRHRRCR